MPTYEYACPKCKKNYEIRESFSAETTHTCQECGKGIAKRVLHAPRVHFKGSGFYVTDSKSKSRGSEPSTAASPDSGSASGGESSSESSSGGSESSGATESKPKADAKPKSAAPTSTESAAS